MTMHLIQGINTLNTRRPKFKMTKAKESSWREDFAIYNRELKRQGQPRLCWEQYVDMRLGKIKVSKPVFKPLTVSNTHPRYQDRVELPSLDVVAGNTLKRETMKYDGERKLLGIAVLHKSCLQPVFSQQEAEEIAKMRRG
jgi:hypothetical protein